jgi:hypothetical protein
MSPRRLRLLLALSLLTPLAVVGCSDSAPLTVVTYPVEAPVTFQGKPAPGAFVAFHPVTPSENVPAPRGVVTRDGQLQVSTFNGGDGAPEGEYVLTVQWNRLVRRGDEVVAGPNVIPRKYASPQTSNLRVRVAAGDNQLDPIRL